ncbi:uncharacterized protein [Watersipora subatra]|uniref:uncharacterized protein n=1 Tax=Watersipora subatra TaxID=2589382 RepID=UPI00355C04DA
MPEPQLRQLVEVVSNGPPKINDDLLKDVLAPVLDIPLHVVSIVGEDNSRKSLLLDSLFSCLQQFQESSNWNQAAMLRRGDQWDNAKCTSGIWLWDKPLILTVDQKQIAVLLIDCQGKGETTDNTLDVLSAYLTLCIADMQLVSFDSDLSTQPLETIEMVGETLQNCDELAMSTLVCITDDGKTSEVSQSLDKKLHELHLESSRTKAQVSKSRFSMFSPGVDTSANVLTGFSTAPQLTPESNATVSLMPEDICPPRLLPEPSLVPEVLEGLSSKLLPEHLLPEFEPGRAPPTPASYSEQATVLVGSINPESSALEPEIGSSETKREQFSRSVQDADSGFVDASSKLASHIVREISSSRKQELGRGVVERCSDLKASFKELAGSCNSGEEAVEEVITKKIYSKAMVDYEKEIQEFEFQNASVGDDELRQKWKQQQEANAKAILSRNRIFQHSGSSAISKRCSQTFAKKLSRADKDLFYVRSGRLLKNIIRTTKANPAGQNIECDEKKSALYKELEGCINTVHTDQYSENPATDCRRAHSLFISGLGDEKDAPATIPFHGIFKDRAKRTSYDLGSTLQPEGDAQQDAPVLREQSEGNSLWDYLDQTGNVEQEVIPDALVEAISQLCSNCGVKNALYIQTPTNPKHIVIIGSDAEAITTSILSDTQKAHTTFSLSTKNCSNLLLTKLFSWKVKQDVAHQTSWKTVTSITSQLVVSATERCKVNPDSNMVSYVVTPAHAFLSSQQCTASAVGECSIVELRKEVESETTMHRYIFEQDEKLVQDLAQPVLLHHKHWDLPPSDPFMQDIALLRLSKHPGNEGWEEKELPLLQCTEKDLRLLEKTGQKIVINGMEGKVVFSPKSVNNGDKKYGHHLAFVISDTSAKSRPLVAGESGSIVYLRGKGSRPLPFGMFIGEFDVCLPGCDVTIYQAVILGAAFAALEDDYGHHLKQIRLLQTSTELD